MKNLIVLAIIVGVVGYFGSKWLLHNRVEKAVDTAVIMSSPFVKIEYDGVSSTMTGELTIDGVTAYITGFADPIYVDHIGIDTNSYFSLLALADIRENVGSPDEVIPESFGFLVEGVRMRVSADYFKRAYIESVSGISKEARDEDGARCTGKYGFSPDALQKLGFNEQVVSLSAHFRRGQGDYSVEFASLIDDMWAIDANLTLAGDMVTELAKGPRYRPRLKEARVEIEDLEFNERVATYCGRLGLSDEETLTAQMDKLRYMGEEYGVIFDEYVVEPYKEFISGKTTLVVTAKPREPIAMSQIDLYAPADVPALLDLKAEAL